MPLVLYDRRALLPSESTPREVDMANLHLFADISAYLYNYFEKCDFPSPGSAPLRTYSHSDGRLAGFGKSAVKMP